MFNKVMRRLWYLCISIAISLEFSIPMGRTAEEALDFIPGVSIAPGYTVNLLNPQLKNTSDCSTEIDLDDKYLPSKQIGTLFFSGSYESVLQTLSIDTTTHLTADLKGDFGSFKNDTTLSTNKIESLATTTDNYYIVYHGGSSRQTRTKVPPKFRNDPYISNARAVLEHCGTHYVSEAAIRKDAALIITIHGLGTEAVTHIIETTANKNDLNLKKQAVADVKQKGLDFTGNLDLTSKITKEINRKRYELTVKYTVMAMGVDEVDIAPFFKWLPKDGYQLDWDKIATEVNKLAKKVGSNKQGANSDGYATRFQLERITNLRELPNSFDFTEFQEFQVTPKKKALLTDLKHQSVIVKAALDQAQSLLKTRKDVRHGNFSKESESRLRQDIEKLFVYDKQLDNTILDCSLFRPAANEVDSCERQVTFPKEDFQDYLPIEQPTGKFILALKNKDGLWDEDVPFEWWLWDLGLLRPKQPTALNDKLKAEPFKSDDFAISFQIDGSRLKTANLVFQGKFNRAPNNWGAVGKTRGKNGEVKSISNTIDLGIQSKNPPWSLDIVQKGTKQISGPVIDGIKQWISGLPFWLARADTMEYDQSGDGVIFVQAFDLLNRRLQPIPLLEIHWGCSRHSGDKKTACLDNLTIRFAG